jgi:hypothetical protein
MPKNKAINLLPQEEFNVSTLGRTLKWAMGTFRIIVIVTEMVVMAAFLSRFWLDAQNSDLTNSIKVKSAQITAQAGLEKEFRNTQSKINIFKEIKKTPKSSPIVDVITSKLPADVTLTGISVSNGMAQVKGTSISEVGIAQFVSNLSADPTFKSVNLGQINSSDITLAQTTFSIEVLY